MKSAFACAFVLAVASASVSTDLGKGPGGKDAMAMFSSLMQGSANKLRKAQSHHTKLVKKLRKQVTSLFSEDSAALGEAIGSYSADLASINARLGRAVNATKKVLASDEAADASAPGDWSGGPVMERAKLHAQIGAAERALTRTDRRNTRSVKEAEERAEGPLEDESNKFGMKLGDTSSVFEQAKTTIETRTANVDKSKEETAAEVKPLKDHQARIKALEADLAAAMKRNQVDTEAAGKKLDTFLAQDGDSFEKKASTLKQDFEKTEKEELKKEAGSALFF